MSFRAFYAMKRKLKYFFTRWFATDQSIETSCQKAVLKQIRVKSYSWILTGDLKLEKLKTKMIPLTLESILEGILDDEMTGSVNPPQVWLLTLFFWTTLSWSIDFAKTLPPPEKSVRRAFWGKFLRVFRLLRLGKRSDLTWPKSYVLKNLKRRKMR